MDQGSASPKWAPRRDSGVTITPLSRRDSFLQDCRAVLQTIAPGDTRPAPGQDWQYRLVAENISDGVLLLGVDQICLYASPSVRDIAGLDPTEVIGTDLGWLIHEEDQPRVQMLHDEIRDGKRDQFLVEFRARHKSGRWIWLEANARAVQEMDGGQRRVVSSFRDIRWRKLLEEQLMAACEEAEENARELYKLATTDVLTSIANRRHFLNRLDEELLLAVEKSQPLSIAILDVDFSKRINDSFGHPAGDAVLVAVAQICQRHVRDSDLIGRLGGEEFGVIMPGADAVAAIQICERLRSAVAAQSITIADQEPVSVTISIGVATHDAQRDASELLMRADRALYAAKNGGRNRLDCAA